MQNGFSIHIEEIFQPALDYLYTTQALVSSAGKSPPPQTDKDMYTHTHTTYTADHTKNTVHTDIYGMTA